MQISIQIQSNNFCFAFISKTNIEIFGMKCQTTGLLRNLMLNKPSNFMTFRYHIFISMHSLGKIKRHVFDLQHSISRNFHKNHYPTRCNNLYICLNALNYSVKLIFVRYNFSEVCCFISRNGFDGIVAVAQISRGTRCLANFH